MKGPDTFWGHKCPSSASEMPALETPGDQDRTWFSCCLPSMWAGRPVFTGKSVYSTRGAVCPSGATEGARPTVGISCVSLGPTLDTGPHSGFYTLLEDTSEWRCSAFLRLLQPWVTNSKTAVSGAVSLSLSCLLSVVKDTWQNI